MLLFLAAFTLPASAKNVVTLTPRSFVATQKKDPYRARIYVECGVDSVIEGDIGADHITVFTAPNALAAMCAYGTDKTLDANPLPQYDGPQSEAVKMPGTVHLWRGALYLRIKGKTAVNTLKVLSSSLPSPTTADPAIEHMRQLPGFERIPGSDRYIAKNVYGWNAFARGYSADYACGDASLSIANIDTQGGAEAICTAVLDEATKRGYAVSAWVPALSDESPKMPAYSMQAVPKTGPTLYLLRTPARLIAIDADIAPTACLPLFEELLRMLR